MQKRYTGPERRTRINFANARTAHETIAHTVFLSRMVWLKTVGNSMNRVQFFALMLSVMVLPSQAATAQGEYDDPKEYARVGVLLGVPSEDFPGSVDLDPGAGFNLTLGRRFQEAYAGEIDFRYLSGAEISGVRKNLSLFSVAYGLESTAYGPQSAPHLPST